jgi:hypothetical protein
MNSDEDNFSLKIVSLDAIYNFVVEKFLEYKIIVLVSWILNSEI